MKVGPELPYLLLAHTWHVVRVVCVGPGILTSIFLGTTVSPVPRAGRNVLDFRSKKCEGLGPFRILFM